jgi:cysteine desulfurase / selenocysteine lyase
MYLNNAATSYPKPERVMQAVLDSLRNPPSEPGRGHGQQDLIGCTRRLMANFLGVKDERRVCFAASGTDALNTAIIGSLEPGDEVVCSQIDHNSVTRPLAHLARERGVRVHEVGLDSEGGISLAQLREAIGPRTRAAVITHVSNVTGAVAPIFDIAALLAPYGATLIVDASQSIGLFPLNLSELPTRTILAAAGHKGLYGPSGTGVLVVPDDRVGQRVFGGTGIRSEETWHLVDLPYRHEAGTPNVSGIAGLGAGLEFVRLQGLKSLSALRNELVCAARHALAHVKGTTLAPLPDEDGRAGIVSFRVQGLDAEQVGFALHSVFGIEVRAGLHCAPSMHRALGTFPEGLVRTSFGAFNDESDVRALVDAVARISVGG